MLLLISLVSFNSKYLDNIFEPLLLNATIGCHKAKGKKGQKRQVL